MINLCTHIHIRYHSNMHTYFMCGGANDSRIIETTEGKVFAILFYYILLLILHQYPSAIMKRVAAALALLVATASALQSLSIHQKGTRFGIRNQRTVAFSYLDDISSPKNNADNENEDSAKVTGAVGEPDTPAASGSAFGSYLDGLPGKTVESNSDPVVAETPSPVVDEALTTDDAPVVELASPEPLVEIIDETPVSEQVEEVVAIPETVQAAPAVVSEPAKKSAALLKTKAFISQRERSPRESQGGALVAINEATVEFTAGVIGGVAGFAIAGPIGAVAVSAVTNYLSKQDDDFSIVLQSLSKTVLEISNYLLKLDSKYDLVYKAKVSIEDAIDTLKEKDGIDAEAIDKVENAINTTVLRMAEISDEYDLWGETTSALGFVGDLVEKTADKVGTMNKELKPFERLWNLLSDAISTARVAVVEANSEAYAEEAQASAALIVDAATEVVEGEATSATMEVSVTADVVETEAAAEKIKKDDIGSFE